MAEEKYLKSKKFHDIYIWHELTAKNEDLYEVTVEEAFPERFMPESAKARSTALADKLATPDVLVEGATTGTPPELSKDAAKGLSKK